MSYLTEAQLAEKWTPVLEHADLPKIEDSYKRKVTAVLLENQQHSLNEDRKMLAEAGEQGNMVANVAKYDPILIGLVRRSMPQLIAYDICGVQPMTGPSGLVFSLKSRFGGYAANADAALRDEALFNEANSAYSGAGTQAGGNPVDGTTGLGPWDGSPGYTHGTTMATATAETLTPAEMSFSIEKQTVTAGSRALKAEYTIELQQDLKSVHGLDAEAELSNILSTEITAEMNREVVRRIYTAAVTGCETGTVATAGTFDLDVDANGRWSVERFKGLMFQIEREANRIAQTTKRGRGNFILCSADVASALQMAGVLDYKTGIQANLNVDDSSTTYAGMLNGKYKVYVDPYSANGAASQFCVVGYKGSSPFDAGMFYCPYIPLQLLRAVDPNTFQPKIGFKTRYGIVGNPMSKNGVAISNDIGLTAQSNNFYRAFRITNLA
jgi:hypothetical protein